MEKNRWPLGWPLAAILIASLLWIVGALMVAFPQRILSFQVGQLFVDFEREIHHPVTLLFLLFLDVVIVAGFLKDVRVLESVRRWVVIFFAALLVYIVTAMWVPQQIVATSHGDPIAPEGLLLFLGCLAIICLVITRALTYAVPEVAVPIAPKEQGNDKGT